MYSSLVLKEGFATMVSDINELKTNVDMFLYYLNEDDGCLAIVSGEKVIAIMQDFEWVWARKTLYIKDKDNKVKIKYDSDMEFSYNSYCIEIGNVSLNIV